MHKLQFMFSILLPLLSACSSSITQPISSDIESIAPRSSIYPLMQKELLDTFGLSKLKMGKSLQLVRIMEGGACKNTQQGAFGLFKLYANLDDTKRIKQAQGSEVFADFELSIQNFSMHALQQAVNHFDFKIATNNSNTNHKQEQQAKSFAVLFSDLIANDIQVFEAKSSLVIDVIPDTDALLIYTDSCETPHVH